VIEAFDASPFESNDEWTCSCVIGAVADCLHEGRYIRGDDERDNQSTKGLEYDKSIDESFCCFLYVSLKGFILPGSDGDHLRAKYAGKPSSIERPPKSQEVSNFAIFGFSIAFESSRMLLIAEAKSVVVGSTSKEENDA